MGTLWVYNHTEHTVHIGREPAKATKPENKIPPNGLGKYIWGTTYTLMITESSRKFQCKKAAVNQNGTYHFGYLNGELSIMTEIEWNKICGHEEAIKQKVKLETERQEKDKQEKISKGKLETDQQENEKLEKEKLEKLEQEKLEKEKLEKEKQAKLEKDKLEKEKLEKEKQAKLEKDKLTKEKLERKKLEKEKLEKEKLEKDRLESEQKQKNSLSYRLTNLASSFRPNVSIGTAAITVGAAMCRSQDSYTERMIGLCLLAYGSTTIFPKVATSVDRFFNNISEGIKDKGISMVRVEGQIQDGAIRADTNIHSGAMRAEASAHSGAVQAHVHYGAAQAHIHHGAAQAHVHQGAVQTNAQTTVRASML